MDAGIIVTHQNLLNDFFVGVPFTDCEKFLEGKNIVATREDEAIAIAVGAWFAGKTPLVYMQNSGLGNCFDIITSLLKPYKIDIELLVNNRTTPEHHALMGEKTTQLMKVIGFETIRYC